MTTLFTSTFSYPNGTTLSGIDPLWIDTIDGTAADLKVDSSGRLYGSNGNDRALYNEVSGVSDLAAEAVVVVLAVNGAMSLVFRCADPTVRTHYQLRYNGGLIRWIKTIKGVGTVLGVGCVVADTVNATCTLRGEVVGDQLRMYVDGVLCETVTDGAIAAGRAGVYLAGTKVRVDSLSVETLGGAGGTTPQGAVTIVTITPSETSAQVVYSYDGTDQTGFEYRVNNGAPAAIGTSPATVGGLTVETGYEIEIRAVNAGGAGAWSDPELFETLRAGDDMEPPTLIGAVSFSSVTQTSYSASWPAGSDNVSVTGYEYQIGGVAGAWTDAGGDLSTSIAGRVAGTTETVHVRAYDALGNRSTPPISGTVTLESIPASCTIIVAEPLKNNAGTLLASQLGIRVAVLRVVDLVSVYEAADVTTNASGLLSAITDAALVTGQQYHVVIKLADGGVGITGPITAL